MTPPTPSEPQDEDPVEALVFETLERMESEGAAAIDEAASKHPEFEGELRSRLLALQAAGLMPGPMEPAVEIPTHVGPFELGKPLGEGGMGLVFEAHDPSVNRLVAIKLIRPQFSIRPAVQARFAREGQAIARLQHPSIARVYQVGSAAGLPYIAMERVHGCTLAQVIDEVLTGPGSITTDGLSGDDFHRIVCRLSESEPPTEQSDLFDGNWAHVVARICMEAAEGLAQAHRSGVLHRDVKASNIMVTPSGRVLLIDFGLAQLDTSATMTATGSRLGSLPYTAPEHVETESAATELADVYSLGVVMYEVLTLRLPFRAGSEAELLRLITRGRFEGIEKIHRTVPAPIAESAVRAMRYDPLRRTPSAEAFAQDLARSLAGYPPIPHGDSPFATIRSRWRAQPWSTSGLAVAILLLIALPAAVMAMRARSAERVADSNHASTLRLQLALDTTASIRAALPSTDIINGTPLEYLRTGVLSELSEIESHVGSQRQSSGASQESPNDTVKAQSTDRQAIQRAQDLLAGNLTGSTNEEFAPKANLLVKELEQLRAGSARSLDVDATLVELMVALASHAASTDDAAAFQIWHRTAGELCAELQVALPTSTWLADRVDSLQDLEGIFQ
ncbi:MAG: serine/threonine-protein kinase [Planctomycetota bacterium]|nr:serine/threonine-protein kinase [Planctomycetota bacterium]